MKKRKAPVTALLLLFTSALSAGEFLPLADNAPPPGTAEILYHKAFDHRNIRPPRLHTLPRPFEYGAPEAIAAEISRFSSDAYRPWLEGVRERSLAYMGFIRTSLEEMGLPWELAYLPAVESAFQVRAVSSSAAAGLWQFMLNSISPYEMTVDAWRDDRRDFWLSTRGALQKLAYNYSVLGDWYLALAAYNCGLGRIQRTIASTGISDYWELRAKGHLPRETASYLPRFLAAAHLLGYPAEAGLALQWEKPVLWERIPLTHPVDLRLLAQSASMDYGLLKYANSELRYPVTPPAGEKYALKVPASLADSVKEALKAGENDLIRYHIHRIRSGDTLSKLSRHFEIPVSVIQQANPRVEPTLLRIGQEILIPAFKDIPPMAPEETMARFANVYRVQPGDSLWSISRRYGISPESLAGNNGMDIDGVLKAGSLLQVP